MFGLPHSVQIFLFFKSVGLGTVTGALFLLFRLLRGLVPHHWIAVFFEDLLLCCFSSLLLFYFLFTCNAGIPRFYLLCGDAVGFCLCLRCFGPLVDRLLFLLPVKNEK